MEKQRSVVEEQTFNEGRFRQYLEELIPHLKNAIVFDEGNFFEATHGDRYEIPKTIPGRITIENPKWKLIVDIQTNDVVATITFLQTQETHSSIIDYNWTIQLYEQMKKIALAYLDFISIPWTTNQ